MAKKLHYDIEVITTFISILSSRYPESGIVEMIVRNLRPRARTILKWNELHVGDMVMVNYNVESPEERGFWFDAEITSLREISRTNKEAYAKIMLG